MSLASEQASTTVRSSRSPRPPALLRFGASALAAAAPTLAARLGARLFLTPPRHSPPRREREALARGDGLAVRVGRDTLRGWRFGEGPAVLLVHGWGGRGGQLASFAPALVEGGCSVIAFDGPAHGSSTGRIASLPHFARAVAAMVSHVGARAAVAHSMGGAAVTLAMARGTPLEAAVVIGAPGTPATYFEGFCKALGLPARVQEAMRLLLERELGTPFEELDLPRMVRALDTPALVVHDTGDAEVPWSEGAAIAAAWSGARLMTTKGLGHRRILRDDGVVSQAADFILSRLARCGCGRLASVAIGSERFCGACQLATELYDRTRRRAV
jgi:pimeloyl-ACP methyl ester carboxylesterase